MPKAVKLNSGPSSKVKAKLSKKKSVKVKSSKAKATMTPQSADPAATTLPAASTPAALDFESGSVYISKVELDASSTKVSLFDANSRTITLLVGQDEIKLFIHENILCEHCPFFQTACKPEWMKDDDATVKLPNDDPELVNIMLYWMYRHVLSLPAAFDKAPVSITDTLDTAPGLLARLFVLAEKYQIIPLQNDIIDAFLVWLDDFSMHHRIPASVMQYIWTNKLSEDCPLRKFLLDYAEAEYTIWDLKTMKDLIVEKDFWYGLSRRQELTIDLVREAMYEEEGEWGDGGLELVKGYVEPHLGSDFCALWHVHEKKENLCGVLKQYVLEKGEEDE